MLSHLHRAGQLAIAVAAAMAITPAALADPPQHPHDYLAPSTGYQLAQHHSSRFVTDTLAPGGGSSSAAAAIPPNRSFSWTDAAAGAVTVFSVLVVLAGATLLVQRRRVRRSLWP